MRSKLKLLDLPFYSRHTVEVAQDLLGKIIEVDQVTARIVEVEAYRAGDPASHSSRGITPRTSVMFGAPGVVYVYTMHRQYLLNFVTEPEGSPGAVLIRAVEPLQGLDQMLVRRPVKDYRQLTNGPGKLCQALGITLSDYGASLFGPRFRVWSDGYSGKVEVTHRIGISQGKDTPWRFVLSGNRFVSR